MTISDVLKMLSGFSAYSVGGSGFGEEYPEVMLAVLHTCGALQALFPFERKYDSVDAGYLADCFRESKGFDDFNSKMRFSLLCSGINFVNVEKICEKLKVDSATKTLAMMVATLLLNAFLSFSRIRQRLRILKCFECLILCLT